MRRIRGKRIGMIFQDPLTSLNPLYRVGDQLIETIQHPSDAVGARRARKRAIELLAEVGIPAPEQRIDSYPHEFSGGMRQRVVIALALCAEPELIIADEPTTALDVSVQAQIIALLKRLGREHGTAVMLVTHDMGVIAETADRVAVMYAGRIAEIGPVRDVVQEPAAPLRQGPDGLDPDARRATTSGWCRSPARMPRLSAIPPGCAFNPRCPYVVRPLPGRAAGADAGAARSRVACYLYDPAAGARRRPCGMTDDARCVEVDDLAPRLRRLQALAQPRARRRAAAISEGGRRRVLRHREGRDLRAGGRIRLAASRRWPHGRRPAAADRAATC